MLTLKKHVTLPAAGLSGFETPLADEEAPGQERDDEGEVHRDVVGVRRLEQLRRTCGCLDGGLDPGLGG